MQYIGDFRVIMQYLYGIKIFRASVAISLLFVSLSFGQSASMIVTMKNGDVITYRISNVKNISFSEMPILEKDRSLIQNVIKKFTLFQNYPNPFNPSTTIEYQIPSSGQVKISIYDIQGRLIRTLDHSYQLGGNHKIIWNGKDGSGRHVASGVYFCQVLFKGSMLIKKLLMLK